jgi:4Fe-4S ferredoxin
MERMTGGSCDELAAKWLPVIDRNRCEGKRTCVAVCPYDVFEMRLLSDADKAAMPFPSRIKATLHGNLQAFAVRAADCHACGLCVTACPEQAIKLVLREEHNGTTEFRNQ